MTAVDWAIIIGLAVSNAAAYLVGRQHQAVAHRRRTESATKLWDWLELRRAGFRAEDLRRIGSAPKCERCDVFMAPVNGGPLDALYPNATPTLCRCPRCGKQAPWVDGEKANPEADLLHALEVLKR